MKRPLHMVLSAMLFCCVSGFLAAQGPDLQGEGRGSSDAEARQFALQDLASQIETRVQSVATAKESYSESRNSAAYKASYNALIKTTVDIPLLGVELASRATPDGFSASATLKAKTAVPVYRQKLVETLGAIDTGVRTLLGLRGKSGEPGQITRLMAQVEEAEKYRSVLAALGEKPASIPQSPAKMSELQDRLAELDGVMDSLEKAARVLTRGMDQKNIYIYPPVMPGSSEVTPFARAVRNALSARMTGIEDPRHAAFLLRGSYEPAGTGMELSCRLVRLDGTVEKASTVRLLPPAFEGLAWQPVSPSMDALIREGMVVSPDFRIEVTTRQGSRDLLFEKGTQVDLLVKMNRAGYFYLVDHVRNDDGTTSLLLPLNTDATGNRMFVYYLNADDANKWVALDSFTVSAPFGIDRLQFVASSKDLADRLPAYHLDEGSGLYLLGTVADDAVKEVRTRGLVPTKALKPASKDDQPLSTEAFLTLTTMDKPETD